jgi:hypothetical protein
MCENTECNKVKTATHTDDECWRKHPDLIPDKLKNKFNRRKNDYVKNHRKGYASQEKPINADKTVTKGYLKKARKFLRRDMKQTILGNQTILRMRMLCTI